jgi:probable F420-dependent oxidoreductase
LATPTNYGLFIANSGPHASPELIRDLADEAERRGYDGCWTNEHPMPAKEIVGYEWPNRDEYIPHYGVQSTLAYIAGRTKRVRLGCSIHPLPYHHTLTLAKAVATLDRLSDGRAILGTGVGWNRQEMKDLGYHDFADRGAFADEALDVILRVWTEPAPSFHGRWHDFDPVIWEPKPLQRPHPPIWVGGESKPAMRRAARLGDGWLLSHMPLDWIRASVPAVHDLMRANGRDPAELRAVGFFYNVKLLSGGKRIDRVVDNRKSSAGYWLEGPADAFVEDLRRFLDAGITYPIVRFYAESQVDMLAQLQIFVEVIRAVVEAS